MELRTLRDVLGQRRLQIVDVGARGDIHPRWQRFSPILDVIGFEADAEECARLNATGQSKRFLPHALSDREGTRTFHVCAGPGYSGLLEPNPVSVAPFADEIRQGMTVQRRVSMQTTTLDTVAAREHLEPDCLKIDVQGGELDILKGAVSVLAGVKLVELEVEFHPQYVGQPLFPDVDRYLRDRQFMLLGLRRTFWRRHSSTGTSHRGGQLIHGDVLYYNAAALTRAANDPRELAIWLTALSAYHQDDFVDHLLDSNTHLRGLRDELAAPKPGGLRLALAKLATLGLSHRPARALVDACRRGPAIDWHDPEFF